MLACALTYAAFFADPVTLVQLRYPANRTTITTTSGYNVVYTLAANAPPELRRAYKALEIAEREVLITEALQLLRAELVANERRLETLRTARLAAYLTDTRAGPKFMFFDSAVFAPPESQLRFRLSDGLAADAQVERAFIAIDRLVEAHRQLHQTLTAIAHPNRKPPEAKPPVFTAPLTASAIAAVPATRAIAEAEKAEKVVADAELVAEERERAARLKERAADANYRDASPNDRSAARESWLKARDEWEQTRREWDAAREKWQTARDLLDSLRRANTAPVAKKQSTQRSVKPSTNTRYTPGTRPR